jgi:hypothetical protein
MVVGIFRTNICTQQDKHVIIQAIRDQFNISDCTIDIDDCDKVMRIIAGPYPIRDNDVVNFVRSRGFSCELLD